MQITKINSFNNTYSNYKQQNFNTNDNLNFGFMAKEKFNFRAAYEQVQTTPRVFGIPPTMTGFPRREGLSRISTEA